MYYRVGLIVPSSNTIMENDFHRLVPRYVSVHTSRIYMVNCTVRDELEAIEKHLKRAVIDVATVKPDVIVFGCTSAAALKGKGFDLEVSRRVADISGVRAVSVPTAVLAALGKLHLKRITVVTPYIRQINDRIRRFLEVNGIYVDNIDGMEIKDNFRLADPGPDEIYQFAKNAFRKRSQGLFLSCTNFRGLEAIDRLEKDLGRPVLSSNSATVWYVLNTLGAQKPLRGYGRLLSMSV